MGTEAEIFLYINFWMDGEIRGNDSSDKIAIKLFHKLESVDKCIKHERTCGMCWMGTDCLKQNAGSSCKFERNNRYFCSASFSSRQRKESYFRKIFQPKLFVISCTLLHSFLFLNATNGNPEKNAQ